MIQIVSRPAYRDTHRIVMLVYSYTPALNLERTLHTALHKGHYVNIVNKTPQIFIGAKGIKKKKKFYLYIIVFHVISCYLQRCIYYEVFQ